MKYLLWLILVATFLLPFITGAWAVAGRYDSNPWTWSEYDPVEAFIMYAWPLPMALGCAQIFFYPITFGPVYLLLIRRTRRLLLPVVALYLVLWTAFYLCGLGGDGMPVRMYPIVDGGMALLVLGVACGIDWRSGAGSER